MKRLFSWLFALVLIAACISCASCGEKPDDKPTPTRTFAASYSHTVSAMGDTPLELSARVLISLMSDGNAEIYVGFIGMGEHKTAHYTGTYTLGENDEHDETITLSYKYSESDTATIDSAVIIDGKFSSEFYIIPSMTSEELDFYEIAPITPSGNSYVGFLSKTGGMGQMIYAYCLNLESDGTFTVSILQQATVMHVTGTEKGTYTSDGDTVTFTYDVIDEEIKLQRIQSKKLLMNGIAKVKEKKIFNEFEKIPPVLFQSKEECCGCSACYAICSVHAIYMEEDEEGFLYPKILEDRCKHCYQCLEVCAFKEEQKKSKV